LTITSAVIVTEAVAVTVNVTPLLATPPTFTTTFPVVAPLGTVTAMPVAFQLDAVPALVPLNVTELVPWLDPKLLPPIVTAAPTGPEVTERLVMLGVDDVVTVNVTPLLATPPTFTTTFPVVAPLGTVTAMPVALQLDAAPAPVPLNVTVLVPWLDPKLLPLIVTAVPTGPEVTERLVMLGVDDVVTVNVTPALETPPAVTTTFPVVAPLGTVTVMLVALQLDAVPALVPLKVTVLVPWLDPKLVPAIVTAAPTGPEGTDRLVMLGTVFTVRLRFTEALSLSLSVT